MKNQRRSQHVRLKYTFSKAHRREFDTAHDVSPPRRVEQLLLCWLRNPLSDRAREEQRLLGLIVAAYCTAHDFLDTVVAGFGLTL